MLASAEDLDFEEAAKIRDEINRLNETSLLLLENPMIKNLK
jgi:protein-arginine kinase activator protein McsA